GGGRAAVRAVRSPAGWLAARPAAPAEGRAGQRGDHAPVPVRARPRPRRLGGAFDRAGAAGVSVAELIEGRHVCICAGAGGVGKTTTSAAIAVGMAARGLKVAVLTIDPAKRLASSLGLSELDNEERRIEA